jgi:hypothetical protein
MIFGSPRQALAYVFACERGPGLAQPKWHDAPRSTDRHHLDHVEVAALLYGPIDQGCCGVVRDSELDQDLRAWATERGTPRTNEVLAIERRLRALLRAQGVMVVRHRFVARRHLDTGDGTPTLRAVGFTFERKSLRDCPGSAQTSSISDTCA